MEQTYVLILGAPRSGTTLLTAMVGCHDEVAILNEELGSAAKRILGKRVIGNKLCIPNQIEISRKRARWVQFVGKRGFCLLHRYGYFRYRPEGLLSIEDYLRWGAVKMIGIIRDGNAVVSSIQQRGGQPLEVAIYRWRRCIEVLSYLRMHYSEHLLLLSFEHLVTEPESCMRAVAGHLDLAYQPRMLDGYQYTHNYPNEQKIDPERAVKHVRSGIEYGLHTRYPEIHEKYLALLGACAGAPASAAIETYQLNEP